MLTKFEPDPILATASNGHVVRLSPALQEKNLKKKKIENIIGTRK
jgi:hypothetical protein